VSRPITFLSDYGVADEFAGTCRAVIARIAPEVTVIDISHGVPRHDVARGAAMLANSLPYAPPGVHLAVVDPGVGSERRAVAVRVAEEDRVLVGPDNGLFGATIELFGGAAESVEIGNSPVRLEPVSATFHGRDVFAPVAAHLALGMSLAAVGDPIDPGELVELDRPAAKVEAGGLTATVGYLDHFGNATLIAGGDAAAEAGLVQGATVRIEAHGASHEALFALTFADVAENELVLYLNSSGGLALAVNLGSAAERLGIAAGDEIALRPA
jgi:S-adenosylmethionine hydrolase